MRKIVLPSGKHTLVDDSTYAFVTQWTWYNNEHNQVIRTTKEKGKLVLLHRLLLNFPINKEIDHINGNPLDNRLSNLRICSHSNNLRNSKRYKNNTSGFKGVSLDNGKWRATIWFNNKKKNLGRFETPEVAAQAYDKAASKYFGEFARPNQI